MLRFGAIGRDALGRWALGAGIGETGEGIPAPEIGADVTWPFDDLKPRDIGIYPMFGNIGGGVALAGREPVTTSTGGHWRFVLGAIPVKTRANILAWRAIEAQLEGRGKTVAIPVYDGKRAPWPGTPGGTIDAESFGDVEAGDTAIQITPIDMADPEPGMGFSVADRYYRIETVQGESAVFDVTIFPPVRDAWPAGQALEFRRPICRVRLADALGMSLESSHEPQSRMPLSRPPPTRTCASSASAT